LVGFDREPPIAWGGLDVAFKWEVENPVIVGLSPVYELAGVSLDEERGFLGTQILLNPVQTSTPSVNCLWEYDELEIPNTE